MFRRGKALTIVRVYKGHQQGDAVKKMQRDAAHLAREGYFPVSQSWAQGQWGCGAFLIALVLFVVLIGILVFIYMLLVKPEGTLTVTYALQPAREVDPQPTRRPERPGVTPTAAPTVSVETDIPERIKALLDLRDRGLITKEDYEAKKANLLKRM